MKSLKFQLLLGTACILILCLLASCSDTVVTIGEEETGSEAMTMSLNFQPLTEMGLTITRVHAHIQKGEFLQEMDLEINGNMAEGIFENLTPGLYEIQVHMYAGEDLVATGSGEGVVVAGDTTTVTIQMEIENGNLEVIVVWGPGETDYVVAHWTFDEGEGETLLDYSGNSNHGTIIGASWAPGYSGNALFFDELSDEVVVSHNSTLNLGSGPFTIEAIIRSGGEALDPTNPVMSICTKYSMSNTGFLFDITANEHTPFPGQVYFNVNGSSGHQLFSLETVTDDKWHHIAIVRDADFQSSIYIDGVLIISGMNEWDTDLDNTVDLKIGHDTRNGVGQANWTFHGWIDELRVSNEALDPDHFLPFSTGPINGSIVDFTPFSPEVKWIEINDRDPVGLPLLRWQYEISDIPANPTLSFDYAGAETEITGIWLWDEFLSYLPATGGDETFQHFEINIDPSLLVVGKNYIGFVSGYLPSQGEADGVLFKNVKLGDHNFTPFAPNVEWVECNDRDPVGLPFLRWSFILSSIPENPSLVFEYAGAETDETQFWVGESHITNLPSTGGGQEFSSYEIEIDPALLNIGSNQLGFISGYLPSQNEADGILFRDVRLIGGD